jgi:hypothetical protein
MIKFSRGALTGPRHDTAILQQPLKSSEASDRHHLSSDVPPRTPKSFQSSTPDAPPVQLWRIASDANPP